MILLFFGIALILSLLIFIFPKRIIIASASILYVLAHLLLTVYSYENLDLWDTAYFKFDSLAVLLNGLLSLLLIPVTYHAKLYLQRHVNNPKKESFFAGVMILLSTAISSVYFAENIVVMWVSIEITTLAVSFLIYHTRYDTPLEASWKYLFLSSFGIAIAFLGILILASQATSAEGADLSISYLSSAAAQMDPFFLKMAFVLILTGYSVKLNVFPLFAATIDAKTVAPSPVNAIISTALVNAGFVAIFRVYSIINQTALNSWAQHIFLLTGLISLALATIQLFRIKRFKRMFAFSSMEHVSLILIALSVGKLGYYAALLHLAFHTLIKGGLFFQFGQIRAYFHSGWIKDSGSYFKLNGIAALAFIVGILSITAIPPSGMFVSEFLIFKALFARGAFITAITVLTMLTVIIYVILKKTMHLLYAELPANFNPDKVIANKFEPISQFLLFGLVTYLGFNPPAVLTNLIHATINLLN
ncbi:MAG TPA: proton-conducting transporter membrane subunit [Draconibacterium sp.]|nr:proton-conducting transporter membrane subunit [Draconibacterium sp.]